MLAEHPDLQQHLREQRDVIPAFIEEMLRYESPVKTNFRLVRRTTTIGDRNWLLGYVHIAHDCRVGNDTTFSNNSQLAGHVSIDDFATLGGFTGVHQFCRVGAHAMVAACSIVLQDVPPFITVSGYPAKPAGTNNEGLRRRGFAADEIAAVRRAYKLLYREGFSLADAKDKLAGAAAKQPVLVPLVAFLEQPSRGIVR